MGDQIPGRHLGAAVQKPVGTLAELEAAAQEHGADRFPVVDGLEDILGEAVDAVLEDLRLQMHPVLRRAGDLEPGGNMLVKFQIKRLLRGDLLLVQQVEDEVPAGGEIGVHILKNLPHVGKLRDVIHRIAGTGNKVELPLRPVGDHIRHIVADPGIPVSGNLDHTCGEIHSGIGTGKAILQDCFYFVPILSVIYGETDFFFPGAERRKVHSLCQSAKHDHDRGVYCIQRGDNVIVVTTHKNFDDLTDIFD